MSQQADITSPTEAVRVACLNAALEAYEDAGIRGLCAEGRWEAALAAIRHVDLSAVLEPRADSAMSMKAPGR
jgi:hypothetical protein